MGRQSVTSSPRSSKGRYRSRLALAPFLFEDCKINVIDTPGYADFVAEVEAGLSVADLAVLVVSAVEGVEVQTEETWRLAAELGLPRLVFVNKLDRERADFERTLDQLRERFGSGIAPLELPIGTEAAFNGVADLLTDTAITYLGAKSTTGPIPEDMSELEHRVREALIEGIVVADDELMERYLEGEVPSTKELESHSRPRCRRRDASSRSSAARPSPASASTAWRRSSARSVRARSSRGSFKVQAGNDTIELPRDPDGPPLARVFKTIADPFVGRISLMEVLSGTLRPDMTLVRQPQPHRGEAARPAGHARQGDPAHLGGPGRRHRRRREAERCADRATPWPRRTSRSSPKARGSARRSCPSPSTRRPRATTTSS